MGEDKPVVEPKKRVSKPKQEYVPLEEYKRLESLVLKMGHMIGCDHVIIRAGYEPFKPKTNH